MSKNLDFILTPHQRLHYDLMLSVVKGIQSEKPLILKGGTALLMAYGLDRFSEDLDFDVSDKFDGNTTIKLDSIIKQSTPNNIEITHLNLRKNTQTVNRYMLGYREKNTETIANLKIETSYRNRIKEADIVKINGLLVVPIENIAQFKCSVLLDNNYSTNNKSITRTQIRDLYDADFIMKHYPSSVSDDILYRLSQLDINQLESRYRQSFTDDQLLNNSEKNLDELIISLMESTFDTIKNKTIKLDYHQKSKELDNSGKLKLKAYERVAMQVIGAVPLKYRERALLNYYENTAKHMKGTQLMLPEPLKEAGTQIGANPESTQNVSQQHQSHDAGRDDEQEMDR